MWSSGDYGDWGKGEAVSVGWDWLARGVRVRAMKACRRDLVHKSAVEGWVWWVGRGRNNARTPEGKNRVKSQSS